MSYHNPRESSWRKGAHEWTAAGEAAARQRCFQWVVVIVVHFSLNYFGCFGPLRRQLIRSVWAGEASRVTPPPGRALSNQQCWTARLSMQLLSCSNMENRIDLVVGLKEGPVEDEDRCLCPGLQHSNIKTQSKKKNSNSSSNCPLLETQSTTLLKTRPCLPGFPQQAHVPDGRCPINPLHFSSTSHKKDKKRKEVNCKYNLMHMQIRSSSVLNVCWSSEWLPGWR